MAIKRTPALVYDHIEHVVKVAQRDLGRAVFPWEVQGRLLVSRAEGSLRRDMYKMYQAGRLVRVGGDGARRGYRLPSRMERLAWVVNAGLWPLGAERVMLWAG